MRLVISSFSFPGGEEWYGYECIGHGEAGRCCQCFTYASAKPGTNLRPVFVFELVHEVLQQGVFGKVYVAGSMNEGQPSAEDMLYGIIGIVMEVGQRQPAYAREAQQLLMAYYIIAASRTTMGEEDV